MLQRFNDGCVCSFQSMYKVCIGTNIDLVITYSFGYGHVIFLYLHLSRVSGSRCSSYTCETNYIYIYCVCSSKIDMKATCLFPVSVFKSLLGTTDFQLDFNHISSIKTVPTDVPGSHCPVFCPSLWLQVGTSFSCHSF